MTRSVATTADVPSLLAPDEPPAAEVFNMDGPAPLLFVCDHANHRVPRALGNLGLTEDVFERHVAWDIGAAEVARRLAARFDAPLVLSGYSRLVIDCNRALDDPTSIPAVSDDVEIPANIGLSPRDARARAEAVFEPYHKAIDLQLAAKRQTGIAPALISIHSFTPVFGGFVRPWHIGVLWNSDGRLAVPFMAALRQGGGPHGGGPQDAGLEVGDNEPYSARENYGQTVAHHGEAAGIPHLLIEIRQDLIDTPEGADRWSGIIGQALDHALAHPEPRS